MAFKSGFSSEEIGEVLVEQIGLDQALRSAKAAGLRISEGRASGGARESVALDFEIRLETLQAKTRTVEDFDKAVRMALEGSVRSIESFSRPRLYDFIYADAPVSAWYQDQTLDLPKSFNFVPTYRKTSVEIKIQSDLDYAGVQERGDVTSTENWMSVPDPNAGLGSGASPISFMQPWSPGATTWTKFLVTKTGDLRFVQVLALGKGSKPEIMTLFYMKKRVKVPRKGYLLKLAEELDSSRSKWLLESIGREVAASISLHKVKLSGGT